jgi:hypothetical protein
MALQKATRNTPTKATGRKALNSSMLLYT